MSAENKPMTGTKDSTKDPADLLRGRLSISRQSEEKIDEAMYRLASQIGLFIVNSRNIIVVSQTNAFFSYQFRPSPERKFFVFAISDRDSDLQDFNAALQKFNSRVSNIFSPREINLKLVADFVSSYASAGIYDAGEKVPAIEFAFVEIHKESKSSKSLSVQCRLVNFIGEKIDLIDEKFAVLGCSDEDSRGYVVEKLRQYDMSGLPPKKVKKIFQDIIESFNNTLSGKKDEDGEYLLPFAGDFNEAVLYFKTPAS